VLEVSRGERCEVEIGRISVIFHTTLSNHRRRCIPFVHWPILALQVVRDNGNRSLASTECGKQHLLAPAWEPLQRSTRTAGYEDLLISVRISKPQTLAALCNQQRFSVWLTHAA
jgi:hypothetical protein